MLFLIIDFLNFETAKKKSSGAIWKERLKNIQAIWHSTRRSLLERPHRREFVGRLLFFIGSF